MSKQKKISWTKLSKKKIFLIVSIIVCLVVLLSVGTYFMIAHIRKNAIELQYGDYSITKERYDELIAEAQDAVISSSDAREQLIASLKAQAAAKKVGLKEDEYKSVATALAFDTAKRKMTDTSKESYHQRAKYPEAIETELQYRSEGGYRVVNFEFPFTHRIYTAMINDLPPEENPSEEKSSKPTIDQIREDEAYSRARAEEAHKKLEQKSTPYWKIVEGILNDSRLVHGGAANTSGMTVIPFTSELERGDGIIMLYGDAAETFSKQTPGNISPITDVLAAPYNQEYPEELNAEDGLVRTGFQFTYYIEKIKKQPDILQRYQTALEEL